MRKPTAALGSAVFFVLAPGVVVGLIPWLLTGGWQVREPLPYWMPMRVLGGILLIAGLMALLSAFVRFVVEGLGTPALPGGHACVPGILPSVTNQVQNDALAEAGRVCANERRQRVCTLRYRAGRRRAQADPQRPDRVLARCVDTLKVAAGRKNRRDRRVMLGMVNVRGLPYVIPDSMLRTGEESDT